MKFKFKVLQEGILNEDQNKKAEFIKEINDAYEKNPDKNEWMKKVGECVDKIDNDKLGQVYQAVIKDFGDEKVSEEDAQKIIGKTDKDTQKAKNLDTVAKVLKYLDAETLAKEDPKTFKVILVAILGIIPTPITKILALLIGFVPADVLSTIFTFLGHFNPVHHVMARARQSAIDKRDSIVKDAQK